jgi:hypothetical protein
MEAVIFHRKLERSAKRMNKTSVAAPIAGQSPAGSGSPKNFAPHE